MSEIFLISTAGYDEARLELLRRLVGSIEQNLPQLPNTPCTLNLLLQNCSPEELERVRPTFPAFVSLQAVPTRLSLSAARNIVLRSLEERSVVGPGDIIGFPDDDCWYPPGTLPFISGQFAANDELDFWFCRYASDPKHLTAEMSRPASTALVVQHASSNTMFVRGRVLHEVGGFDEDLGVGTPHLGGEDLAFALGSYQRSRTTVFCDVPGIGHREKIAEFGIRYYPGSLLALARHARGHGSIFGQYLRKIAVGLYLVVTQKLSPGAFLKANYVAARELIGASKERVTTS
jgi:hypothetical protein